MATEIGWLGGMATELNLEGRFKLLIPLREEFV